MSVGRMSSPSLPSSEGSNYLQQVSNFESLPMDELFHVFNYLSDDDVNNLYRTSKKLHDVIDSIMNLGLQSLQKHPILEFISKRISAPDCQERVRRIYDILQSTIASKRAFKGKDPLERSGWRHLNPDVPCIVKLLNKSLELPVFNDSRVTVRSSNLLTTSRELSALADQCGGYSSLFLSAFLREECAEFDLNLIATKAIDCAVYISLQRNDMVSFNKLMDYSSIYKGNDNESNGFLGSVMRLAIERRKIEVFCFLISLKKSFPENEVLVDLAENDSGAGIEKFLATNPRINRDFFPRKGENVCESHVPGLHTALMIAANKGNLAALNAMLQAMPDTIPREILEYVRDLLRNHQAVFNNNGRIRYSDWLDQSRNPHRAEIIDRLNQEVERRFPALPIAPMAEPNPVQALPEEFPVVIHLADFNAVEPWDWRS